MRQSTDTIKIRRRLKRTQKEYLYFFLFAAPGIIGFLLLSVYPIFRSFQISFTNRDLLGFDEPLFLWFRNYFNAFNDPYMWEGLKNSFVYAFATLITVNVTGLAAALLMNAVKGRFSNVLRTVFYAPSILPAVSMIIMFTWIFNPAQGIINTALRSLGVTSPPLWLEGVNSIIPTLILMSFWSFGGKMVIYLAGRQGISKEFYEAAALDGAAPFTMFLRITLPLLSPVLFYNVLMSLIGGIQVFTEAYVIGGTGTGVTVNFFVLNIYSHAFNAPFNLGYASALAWILFFIVIVLSAVYFALSRKFLSYGED